MSAGVDVLPRRLGQYELKEKIGAGGMGAVYRAIHQHLGRLVALKVLPSALVDDRMALARFQREMQAIGALDHPNIVRATDAGEADGTPYLVMDLIDGIDLAKLVARLGPLPVAESCRLAEQVAIGLRHIREHGIVHRDIKPSNLLLTRSGVVKILDLGLVRLQEQRRGGQKQLTLKGELLGTPDYMAPEQWMQRPLDIRADIYSLGCTLHFLLIGRPPFCAPDYPNLTDKMRAHLSQPPVELRERRGDVPPALESIFAKMLAKEPDDRFQDPGELAEALAEIGGDSDLRGLAQRSLRGVRGASTNGDQETIAAAEAPELPAEREAEEGPTVDVVTPYADDIEPEEDALAEDVPPAAYEEESIRGGDESIDIPPAAWEDESDDFELPDVSAQGDEAEHEDDEEQAAGSTESQEDDEEFVPVAEPTDLDEEPSNPTQQVPDWIGDLPNFDVAAPEPAPTRLPQPEWPDVPSVDIAALSSASCLFDAVLAATLQPDTGIEGDGAAEAAARPDRFTRFLRETSLPHALLQWEPRWGIPTERPTKRQVVRRLQRDVATIDRLLSEQVDAILHAPRLQQLEASWRGVRYLVGQCTPGEKVVIRVLDITWKEVHRDLSHAIEFDQSQLFDKVYEKEFGTPGGEPFGLLLGDYTIRHRPSPSHRIDDLETLSGLAEIAAASFAPFVAAADPVLLSLESFQQLQRPIHLERTLEQEEYLRWNALRRRDDSRFVGLVLPRVLMRPPYHDLGIGDRPHHGFSYHEDVSARDGSSYLWGNACYAFGAVAIRAFERCGWFAEIRGVKRGTDEGGLVLDLPIHSFETDSVGVAHRPSLEVQIADVQEKQLAELGLIPLCHCVDSRYAAFYATPSIQDHRSYDSESATANSAMSALLHYMLCVSRFAHYLKVICRDRTGSFEEADDCETFLHDWVHNYVTPMDQADSDMKAEYPLREARVDVHEIPGKPGSYGCNCYLSPHYQLDDLIANVRLKLGEVAAPR